MPPPARVLVITREHVMRNLLEQIFIIREVPTCIVPTLQEAEAAMKSLGLAGVGLVMVDIAALGGCEDEQLRNVQRVLQAWPAPPTPLPTLLIGTLLQKYTASARPSDHVQFLAKPFHLGELTEAIGKLYGPTAPRHVPLPPS